MPRKPTKALAILLLLGIAAAYPLILYFGTGVFSFTALALLLPAVITARLLITGGWRQASQLAIALLVTALSAAALLSDNTAALKYYPVLMNLAVAIIFALSLKGRQTVIEAVASRFTDLSQAGPEAQPYMRRLTAIWAVLIAANGIVSAYTACCMTTRVWAVYNGAFAYGLFGAFMVAELIFRHFYRRRVERRHQTATRQHQD